MPAFAPGAAPFGGLGQASPLRLAGVLLCIAALACGDGENPMDTQEPENPCASAVDIALGQSIGGSLAGTDCRLSGGVYADRWRLTIAAATDVRIDLRSNAFDAFLELQTTSGAVIAANDDAGSLDSRIIEHLEAGTYIILARSLGPSQTGSYTLSVVVGPDCSAVGALELGGSETGTLETSDCLFDFGGYMDNWSLSLAGPEKLQIELKSAAFDEIVLVRDAQGQILDGADWGGPAGFARLQTELPAGEWTISVTSYSESQVGGYELSVDVAPPCTPGTEIIFGESETGTLSSSSCLLAGVLPADSFALALGAETAISLQMKSADFPPLVVVRDQAGADVAVGYDETGDGIAWINMVFQPGSYGLYASSTQGPQAQGGYTLTVSEIVCPEPSPIAYGETVNGDLDPTDCLRAGGPFRESWELVLDEEAPVRIDLVSADFDAYLELRADDGTLIEADDDGGSSLNSRIERTLAAGTYEIVVSSFGSGQVGDYELTVAPPPPPGAPPVAEGSPARTKETAGTGPHSFLDLGDIAASWIKSPKRPMR
jgi:hypothetical protein